MIDGGGVTVIVHVSIGQVIVNDDTGGSVAGSDMILFEGDCSMIEKGSERS